jgi:uncharacterized protein YbbK (DUF523 family)/uncharacterized protein YbgA (DUF1722 family)
VVRPAAIRLGISSCLLGHEVRYDGGEKRDRFLTDVLGRVVEWVPVCPEVELGMGVPREPVRLVGDGDAVRMLAETSGRDHTRAMQTWARRQLRLVARLDLCGYVLKQESPSCGVQRVRVHGPAGRSAKRGRGLFAAELRQAFPHLPVEEEGRLADPAIRESFVERIFAYRRLRSLFAGRWTRGALLAFHGAHELQLLSHAPRPCAELGRLLGDAGELPRAELSLRYEEGFMSALGRRATPRGHASAMRRALRSLRPRLDAGSRRELLALIESYRSGLVPLRVPLAGIRHHARRLDVEYLRAQHYLEPQPEERMLRNGGRSTGVVRDAG